MTAFIEMMEKSHLKATTKIDCEKELFDTLFQVSHFNGGDDQIQ